MRRRVWGWLAWGAFLLQGGFAVAQNSLDALEQELNEAKQQHQEVTMQALSNFFSQIDTAMASPDAAVSLYQQAGGAMPEAAPVVTEHVNETPTEREARVALDQANTSRLGAVLQLHCGLMHFAALFIVKPDQPGLRDDWIAWLKSAAQSYPQLAVPAQNSDHKHPPPFDPADIKGKSMRDSIIGRFLGFNSWGDKEQGGWSVRDLPRLYRANVLDPLRASPTPDTLAAWDTYIAMLSADERDNDRWNQVVYPGLQFDRTCDDYAVAPSTEKLEALVNLIKANPTHPQVEDWIARVHKMMADYRASHGGAGPEAQNPAPSSSSNPNVTVTTQQQGDATIITTHTNSPPVTNAPPAP